VLSVFWFAMLKVRLGMVGRWRAFGRSMEPVIPNGSRVTIEPVDLDKIELGDIVLAQVHESAMLHLVKAIDARDRRVEISGTTGPANDWTTLDRVRAICTEIDGKPVPGARAKVRAPAKPCRQHRAEDGRGA
jgi:hypothetical protein